RSERRGLLRARRHRPVRGRASCGWRAVRRRAGLPPAAPAQQLRRPADVRTGAALGLRTDALARNPGMRAERLISTVLRVGVIASLTTILLGTVIALVHHPEYVTSPRQLVHLSRPSDNSFPHTLRDVLTGLLSLRGQAIVVLGLLMLIATPVARVAVSILLFLEEGDLTYVAITSTVLGLLLLSFFVGSAG